jgi:hypothetical protein
MDFYQAYTYTKCLTEQTQREVRKQQQETPRKRERREDKR